MDTVDDASVKLVENVNEAKTQDEVLNTVHKTVLSYKPDLSSITHEVRSLIKTQDAKIDAQTARIDTLTTLVNSQGTRIEELINLVKAIPLTPPTPSSSFTTEDRTMLQSHSTILTSQDGLLKTIAETLERLLTANKQTSGPAMAEGEKSIAVDAAVIPSNSVPLP